MCSLLVRHVSIVLRWNAVCGKVTAGSFTFSTKARSLCYYIAVFSWEIIRFGLAVVPINSKLIVWDRRLVEMRCFVCMYAVLINWCEAPLR